MKKKTSRTRRLAKKTTTTKTVKTASREGMRGGSIGGEPRKCSVCHKRGHNRRSHEPGGKLHK